MEFISDFGTGTRILQLFLHWHLQQAFVSQVWCVALVSGNPFTSRSRYKVLGGGSAQGSNLFGTVTVVRGSIGSGLRAVLITFGEGQYANYRDRASVWRIRHTVYDSRGSYTSWHCPVLAR